MSASYLTAILRFTFRRLVLRTDALQIILASAIPALYHWAGLKMPAGLPTTTLAFIGYAALGWLTLRLVTAPYFIWREQNERIRSLEDEVNSPELVERKILAERRAGLRIELVDILGKLKVSALNRNRPRDADLLEMHELTTRATAVAEQFSHDQILIQGTRDFTQYCNVLMDEKTNSENTESTRTELIRISDRLFPTIQLLNRKKS